MLGIVVCLSQGGQRFLSGSSSFPYEIDQKENLIGMVLLNNLLYKFIVLYFLKVLFDCFRMLGIVGVFISKLILGTCTGNPSSRYGHSMNVKS